MSSPSRVLAAPERVSGLRVTQPATADAGCDASRSAAFSAAATMARRRADSGALARLLAAAIRGRVRTSSVSRSRSRTAPHTVIGVLSPDFPLSGSLFAGAPIDLYLPLTIDGNEDIGGFMAVIGRLRPGVTVDQARAELASRQAALSVGKWQWMTVLAQQRDAAARSRHARCAIAGAPAPGRHRMRAADGVREPGEPSAGARERAPSRDAGADGARCLDGPGARPDDG